MRELLRWLVGLRDENSKDTARNRLRLVLIQDRIELAPEKMEAMKREIWQVVSRYMVVEDDFLEFEVRRLDELILLVSNIQVGNFEELFRTCGRLVWMQSTFNKDLSDLATAPSS